MANKQPPATAIPTRSGTVVQPQTAVKPKADVPKAAPAVAGYKAPTPAKPPVAKPKV